MTNIDNIPTMEMVAVIQSLLPELIWDKTLESDAQINFVCTKKRINYNTLEHVCNFVKGYNLKRIKTRDKRFIYSFWVGTSVNSKFIFIRTGFVPNKVIHSTELVNGLKIKYIK